MNRDQWIAILLAISVHGLVLFTFREHQPAAPAPADRSPVDVHLVAALPEPDSTPAQAQKPEPTPEPSRPPLPSPVPAPSPDLAPSPVPSPTPSPELAPRTLPKSSPRPTPPVRNQRAQPKHAQPTPNHNPKPKSRSIPQTSHRAQSAARPRADFRSDSTAGTDRADVAPSYLSHPQPAYPEEAREMGRQGVVILDVIVSADGRAVKVALARSSGAPDLDQAALAAVRSWTFLPGRRAGVPVVAHALVPVRFHLD